MTRDSILQSVAGNKKLQRLAASRDPNGDLWQQTLLYLCEMDHGRLVDMHKNGFLDYHVVCCITRSSWLRDTITKHSRYVDSADELPDTIIEQEAVPHKHDDEILNLVNILIEKENTFDRDLFRMATIGIDLGNGEVKTYKSIAEISRQTGIKYITLYKSFQKTAKRINEQVTYITGKGWAPQWR